ncbi:MAG: hypothetical protein ACPLYF_01250 [Fervidobacterium sp.]|jgi:hypothetical protein
MKLLEVFRDFSLGTFSPPNALKFAIKPKKKKLRVRPSTLEKAIALARKRDPTSIYTVEKKKVGEKEYVVITRRKMEEGREVERLSLYYDKKEGKWYVPASEYNKKPRKVKHFVFMRLNDLELLRYVRVK